jgi:hypothetical protein
LCGDPGRVTAVDPAALAFALAVVVVAEYLIRRWRG